jgi:hypothetical protein
MPMAHYLLSAFVVLPAVALTAGCRGGHRARHASTGYDDSVAARVRYDRVQEQLSMIESTGYAPDFAVKWSPDERRAIAAAWEHFRAGAVVSLRGIEAFPRYKVEEIRPGTLKVTLRWVAIRTTSAEMATPGQAEFWCSFSGDDGHHLRVGRAPPEDATAQPATQQFP